MYSYLYVTPFFIGGIYETGCRQRIDVLRDVNAHIHNTETVQGYRLVVVVGIIALVDAVMCGNTLGNNRNDNRR